MLFRPLLIAVAIGEITGIFFCCGKCNQAITLPGVMLFRPSKLITVAAAAIMRVASLSAIAQEIKIGYNSDMCCGKCNQAITLPELAEPISATTFSLSSNSLGGRQHRHDFE